MLNVAVITVSDRAKRGEYQDLSGPAICETVLAHLPDCQIYQAVVADEKKQIRQAILNHLGCDYIITTGGTGLSKRDVTPEVTRELCDLELPGISEWLRRESMAETPYAVLSRGFSGLKGKTVIVNFPGSVKAARFCARLLVRIMMHSRDMIHGGGH